MASSCRLALKSLTPKSFFSSCCHGSMLKSLLPLQSSRRYYAKSASSEAKAKETQLDDDDDVVVSSGISRPLSEILQQLNKKVPDSLVKVRVEDGFSSKYIPW